MSEVEKKEARENYSFKKKIFKNIRNKQVKMYTDKSYTRDDKEEDTKFRYISNRRYNKKNKNDDNFKEKDEKVYIIPLGGVEEIGKNMTAFQYKDEIIVVDAGITFPENEHLGIDVIIPDFTYLENNKENCFAAQDA